MNVSKRQRGFSMIETVIVLAIIMIISAVAVINITGVLKTQRVEGALQSMVKETRNARQMAIDRRQIYTVQYVAPNRILTTPGGCGTNSTTAVTVPLTGNVQYVTGAGVAPDGIGSASNAIDLDVGGSGLSDTVCFYPDGSARDTAGGVNNGVVYLALPAALEPTLNGRMANARAMSIFGTTGRIAGWRLVKAGGSWQWRQQ